MNQTIAMEPMRRAISERFREIVERLAQTMDRETVERVLAMADPLSSLGVALEVALTNAAAMQDPLAEARVKGAGSRSRLIEKAGGLLRLSEAARRLGVKPQAVSARRQRGTILAVPLPNGEWVYPACQFSEHGLVRGLDRVLGEFDDVSPWSQLAVLSASSRRFGGRSAMELLKAGRIEEARAIAATYGEQG